MIQIPLSQVGDDFASEVAGFRAALEQHNRGEPGRPAPAASHWVSQVIARVPQDGPVADRGPDQFVILPYEIVDDRPVSHELQILRDSING